ncbi:PIG-L family deacetylase [Streptomyces xinghaiensis]|uniref:PIG-L family deacetylase n=1 Tax=Streptomyces xinghaiensis TaxID=1038928 RepID=UPI00341401D8
MSSTPGPDVSVVVPTYNRAGLLRHTLDSLTRQTLPAARFEVLVVDDGSTDDTARLVTEYEDRLTLRYFAHPDEGYRVARARNTGITNARGGVCVLVDSGVLLHSGALRAHLDSHAASDRPVAVCGYVFCFNEDNEDGAEIERAIDYADPDSFMAGLRSERRWLDIREEFYEKYGEDFAALPAPWLVWWTCNVSARTEQLRSVGLFDDAYRAWGAEDVDLSYRLHRDGAVFVMNRDACAVHVPHSKSYTENMRSVAANYRYFASKYGTPITSLVDGNHFFAINDIIRERGLPGCAEHLAAERALADGPDGPPRQVLVFSPHQDDEVIACGGTLARRAAEGARVQIVFSTDGSRSHQAVLGIDSDPTPEELAGIRQKEAEAAARALGLGPDGVQFLGFTDTALAEALPEFRARVRAVLEAHPDVEEVFLPHEIRELNADHRLTGEVVLDCLRELGLTPRLRKFVVWDEQTEAEFGFTNRSEPDRTVPEGGERLLSLGIREHLDTKRAALAEHRTQVTLYCPAQDRPVVPDVFAARVRAREVEQFWVPV